LGRKKEAGKNHEQKIFLKIFLIRQSSGLFKLFVWILLKKLSWIITPDFLLFSLFLPGFIWVNQEEKSQINFLS